MITKSKKIPSFKNYEEEAEFWDTHDFSEYTEGFRPIKARFAKNLSAGIHIRLDQQTLEEVREEAQQKGIGPTTLIRMWVLEQVQKRKTHQGA